MSPQEKNSKSVSVRTKILGSELSSSRHIFSHEADSERTGRKLSARKSDGGWGNGE